MSRNTFILIAFLSIFAALVVGVNIGRKVSGNPIPSENQAQEVKQQTNPTITPIPTPKTLQYINKRCGLSFQYPSSLYATEIPNGDQFINPDNPNKYFTIMCQKTIERPQVDELLIEKLEVGTVSAYLYHDIAKEDNSPLEKLIFRNPKNKLEIYLGGDKDMFEEIVKTVNIL